MTNAASSAQALLRRHGLRAKRHFGQNFLTDAHLAERIAELATRPGRGTVAEIGAGLGALTRPLLQRAARVVAIERDRDLVRVLRDELADALDSGQLLLEEADAKTAPYRELLASGPAPHTIAGNLPYQITGPLLEKLTGLSDAVETVVLLVQLEVAERLTARAGQSQYGALSVFVRARYSPRREFVIRRGAFYPQPKVDSAVVVLEPRDEPLAAETDVFRSVVKAAFGQRRKMLKNAWSQLLGRSENEIADAAARAGIDLSARGESLEVADFARMAAEVSR